jgi:hypothetical protein
VVQQVRPATQRRNPTFGQIARTRSSVQQGFRCLQGLVRYWSFRSRFRFRGFIFLGGCFWSQAHCFFRYFEGGISSVYLWDIDGGFAGVVLIKKVQDQARGVPMKGSWDSIHVVEVEDKKTTADYKLTSTVMLTIETEDEKIGSISLSGSLTRQVNFLPQFSPRSIPPRH